MFKLFILIVALAGYGVYSAIGGSGSDQEASKQAGANYAVSTSGSIHNALENSMPLAASSAQAIAQSMGVSVAPIPHQGCSGSAISAERAEDLVRNLQEPARSTLRNILELGEPAWTAQLYLGPDGSGICLPKHNKLVLISWLSLTDKASNTPISERIGKTLRSIGDTLPKWFEKR